MNIPDYELAQSRVANDKYSSLDWFLCEHQPSKHALEDKFRSELADLIAFVETETKIHCDAGFEKAIAESDLRPLFEKAIAESDLQLAADVNTFWLEIGFFSGLLAASAFWIGFLWVTHSRGG